MTAMDISAYSFAALGKGPRGRMMKGRNASMLTLLTLAQCALPLTTQHDGRGEGGAGAPNVRYMAASLGPEDTRRQRHAAPVRPRLAASGIAGFSTMLTSSLTPHR